MPPCTFTRIRDKYVSHGAPWTTSKLHVELVLRLLPYPTPAQLAALSVPDDIFLRLSLLFSSSGNYLSSGDIQASCKVSLAFILCTVLKLVEKRKYFISLIMPLLFQITPRKCQCQKYLGDCDWNENRAEEWAVLMTLSRIHTLASGSS